MDNEFEDDATPQLVPLKDGVTDKYIYLSIYKIGGKNAFKGSDNESDHTWASFVPVGGEQVVVAFPRPGKEEVKEDLRPGTISHAEFIALQRMIQTMLENRTHKVQEIGF